MAIRVQYQVPVATGGEIAYQGGRGLFEQERDKYDEGVRQFDEQQGLAEQRLAQQESQYGRTLNYQQELAMLKDRQLQDQMAPRGYQFERGIQATAYDRQQGRMADLQRLGMGEQFRMAGEERADTRRQAQEGRQEGRQLTQERRQRARQLEDRAWEQGEREAQAILKADTSSTRPLPQ